MELIMNEKTFFHVFPTLKVEEEFKVLFADVEVKKITTNSGRDFLHVHLKSHHLIPKKKIWQMEQRIKEQLFGTSSVKLQILEEYELSELYTPEAVMEEYKESLILELKEKVDAAETAAASAGGAANTAQDNGMRAEAVAALVALGYDGASAGRAVASVPDCDRVEDMIMQALRATTKLIFHAEAEDSPKKRIRCGTQKDLTDAFAEVGFNGVTGFKWMTTGS